MRTVLALIVWLMATGLAHAVEVIAHRDVPEQTLTLTGARAMFGMRQTKWSNGEPVRVFVLPDRHPTHVAFVKTRLDLYPYQLRQAWDRLVFSGMAQAPIEVADEREMLRLVAATPGAIGYVRKAGSHDQVKSLAIQ